jgi:hypothetical protein
MGVDGQHDALAALPPGKTWAPGSVWMGAKNLTPNGSNNTEA